MGTIQEAIALYDEEHAFARQLVIPEEDRAKYTSATWVGGYRWFRSPNIVCLEKYRLLARRQRRWMARYTGVK
jgi:hypothetical protein